MTTTQTELTGAEVADIVVALEEAAREYEARAADARDEQAENERWGYLLAAAAQEADSVYRQGEADRLWALAGRIETAARVIIEDH